jgi:hypothetical protein
MTARCSGREAGPYLTLAAGYVRGLMDFAVSRGASRQELAARSGIESAELQNRDNRVFAKYVALMRAGKELCKDPALALHFGEAIDMTEMSLLPSIGSDSLTMAETIAQLNRYSTSRSMAAAIVSN